MVDDKAFLDAPALAVLELLALDSPPGHFQELLDRAHRENLPRSPLEELERATRLALKIQASSHQRRQRESVMADLVNTVHDMTIPYDPDTLLKVITSRARRLLGFDMAYISLRKPGGGSYVHSSDGDTTSLNVGLVVEKSRGLGEMAHETGAPYWTSDYLNDDRIPHGDQLDAVVRAEGLHAIMVVPIRQSGVPIGALYGADRVVRHFTPDEISFMRYLADFAAVALEKARLLDRSQKEIAELESAGVRADATIARMRQLAGSMASLVGLVLGGGDLHELVKAAAQALDAGLVVSDACGHTLACAGEPPDLDEARTREVALETHAVGGPVEIAENVWAAPVSAGEEPVLVLLRADRALTEDERGFLGSVGQAVALLFAVRRSTAVAEGPLRDEYFDGLLTGVAQSPGQLARQAHQLGIDADAPHVVVVVRPEGAEHGKAVVWCSSYAYRGSGLMKVHEGDIVLLLPGTDASAVARAVSGELSPLLAEPVTVASAGPAASLASVAQVYQEALRCFDALIALDGVGSAASIDDLGFLGLLLSDDHDVDGFVASVVGPVLDHDAERMTHLVPTMEAYFAAGSSPTRAAGGLHVHPNTVTRRLERITELLGPGWQQPERATEAQLALRLLRAREVLRRRREAVLGRREAAAGPQDTLGK
ncbi:transcriptional regulator [Streptomyces sp. ERV7]|uniref:helix-turn-helix domain-containing protein n=1 Tax=Streptomyces sp. ERV7 TaxID=1322334 RepID=UPI0007F32E7C|nr:GAF domain-containing protein [Streptomyces sp. ERV7]OAR24885.1 transcriptional regulator [Streptomyces sp. ERV7]